MVQKKSVRKSLKKSNHKSLKKSNKKKMRKSNRKNLRKSNCKKKGSGSNNLNNNQERYVDFNTLDKNAKHHILMISELNNSSNNNNNIKKEIKERETKSQLNYIKVDSKNKIKVDITPTDI